MKHYLILVEGKVQGVFYRANTLRTATSLGITGWIKNQEDGSVLISAQGASIKLEELVKWCKQGPQYAQVTNVECKELPLKNFESFQIIR